MATQVTIKVGHNATIKRVVDNADDCVELENFHWVDMEDISRSLVLYGKYDMKVGDVHIIATKA